MGHLRPPKGFRLKEFRVEAMSLQVEAFWVCLMDNFLDEAKKQAEEASTATSREMEPFKQALSPIVSPTETKATPEQHR